MLVIIGENDYFTASQKEKAMRIARLPLVLMFVALPVWCQSPVPSTTAPMSLEEAKALRARAAALKTEAERRYAADQAACYKKFLVNSCLEDVREPYTQSLIEARDLDKVGRDVEREAHRKEVEAKETARAVQAPQREAEQQTQAEQFRAEEAKKTAERERRMAEKEKQAAEGRKRVAAEQKAHNEKMARRAKEDAERAAKKAAE